ncbi:MAG TPA: hypothetical protein VM286_08225 [Candidatus Thermoplasmatota archaeon]|nr:hypothetical protein [Candidatus Thermoplasmatota archaeon]
MRAWRALLPLLPLVASGCFQALLQAPGSSTLGFACAMMDPVQADGVQVESWIDPRVSLDARPWALRLVGVLANATGRSPSAFAFRHEVGPPPPQDGWNRTNLADAATSFIHGRTVALRILWVESVAEEATGMVAGPGNVVVALDSVQAAALRIGRPVGDVAFAVLLHQVGHAMGATNLGVPVQDPDIQDREGPPGHDKDPASVLNAAWDDARTVTWSDNSTYDRYPAPVLADWAGARGPGGVCA